MELRFEQRVRIGFQYILDQMHPCSPYGQEQLRKIGAYPPEKRAELETELSNLQKIVEYREECRMEIRAVQRIFMQMKNIKNALKKAREMALSEIELFEIKNFLLCTEHVKQQLAVIQKKLNLEELAYEETLPALELLDPDGRRISTFSVYDAYSEELWKIRARKKELEFAISKCSTGKFKDAEAGGFSRSVKPGDSETPADFLVEISAGAEDRITRAGRNDGISPEELKERRRRIVVEEEAEEQRIREMLTERLQPYLPAMEHNAQMTARLDLLLEKAALTQKGHTVRPVITADRLKLTQAVNPYVEQALTERSGKFTPIDLELGRGATVITGANMGGKSVALQTVALNTYLALCGFYVYAEAAWIPHFEELIIVSEDLQSVRHGLSSFGAEVMQLEAAVRAADRAFCFVIFDEFSRGTNPHEGEALVRAVVRFFHAGKSVALLVTHYDHVAEYADAHYQVKGLSDLEPEKVKMEIAAAGEGAGVSVIASHMNYGLYRVENPEDCPKEALNICRLLGLDERILELADDGAERRRS